MFTGIVECTGRVQSISGAPNVCIVLEVPIAPLVLGESIAVNGVCLTVRTIVKNGFAADISPETYEKTNLRHLQSGSTVHIERATPLGGRMGGHMVLGHVDAVGQVDQLSPRGDCLFFSIRAPSSLAPFLASKGSITIDGVSLTLNTVGLPSNETILFDIMLVPHTLSETHLGKRQTGTSVNIEVDILARYVHRQWELSRMGDQHDHDERLFEKLRAGGFIKP